jgi:D-glycero-D-manno-heptose 1,7-bisphosphate phosphatase
VNRSLFLFDIDGTLIRSFMRDGGQDQDYDLIEVLPGRSVALEALRGDGHDVALVTNQAGVAFGYQTTADVRRKLQRVLKALGLGGGIRTTEGERCSPPPVAYVSFAHPKATIDLFLSDSDWRKPGGGMIRQAMLDHDVSAASTTFVGDMDSDQAAAEAAGVRYMHADDFFELGMAIG